MNQSENKDFEKSALLVTSAIHVNAGYTKIVNPEQRIQRVVESVEKFLREYPHLPVLICDGSGFDFTPIFVKYPQVTCICFFTNSAEVFKRGKGYGEGEIINYALRRYFQSNPVDLIFKITGGIYVQNLSSIFNGNLDFQCSFKSNFDRKKRQLRVHRIDTRLFVFRPDFFDANLSKVHLGVDEIGGVYIEDLYYDAIKSLGINLSRFFLAKPPKLIGYSGSTGKPYGTAFGNLLTYPLKNLKFLFVKLALRYKIQIVSE
jgi:hypothetical protein